MALAERFQATLIGVAGCALWPAYYAAVWSDLSSLQDASLLEGFKIGHDVLDLTSIKLEPRHVRMNPLRQRSLQI
jgi:hypothetical protein